MIGASHLCKRYRDRLAVDDLTFEAHAGEILGLLGPNGAGKTTTLRILCGALAPTSGRVHVGDLDLFESPLEARARIGVLPETPPIHPDLRAREHLEHAAALRRLFGSKARAAIERAVERTAITDVLEQRAGTLSRGFRQRLGLALAIVGEPPVLLLDEPTLGLDPTQVIELRAQVRSLASEHTVILSSHLLSEVERICDRVLILSGGHKVAEGTVEDLSSGWSKPGQPADLETLFAALMARETPGAPSADVSPTGGQAP